MGEEEGFSVGVSVGRGGEDGRLVMMVKMAVVICGGKRA